MHLATLLKMLSLFVMFQLIAYVMFQLVLSVSAVDCVADPSNVDCKFYIYPNATADVNMLCEMMGGMVGCDIAQQCDTGKASGDFCDPMSLLGDICVLDDMGGMGSCDNYMSLCTTEGSVVSQCTTSAPLEQMVTTDDSKSAVLDMCNMMPMDDCKECTEDSCPDPFATLSKLCLDMNMEQCSGFYAMCDEIATLGSAAFCGDSSDAKNDPVMRMYLHTGIVDYVIFQDWVPSNDTEYFLTCIFMVFLGVALTYLRLLRQRMEKKWSKPKSSSTIKDDKAHHLLEVSGEVQHPPDCPHNPANHGGFPLLQNTQRMFMTMLIMTIDYFIMLVVMTFNAGLIVACVLGLGLGQLFLGHKLIYDAAPECCA